MRFADLDAVTVDGFGTLVELADPVPVLEAALRARGVERSSGAVLEAFRAEVAFYRPHALMGRDHESLAALRLECSRVFLEAAGADLDPASFVETFVSSIVMTEARGATETLRSLRAKGLELAVVSNWDIGLVEHLQRLRLDSLFTAIVTTAEAGAAKPDPAVFRLALDRLGVEPGRSLHVGDEPDDVQGAAAAGMAFAPAPLAGAFEGWS